MEPRRDRLNTIKTTHVTNPCQHPMEWRKPGNTFAKMESWTNMTTLSITNSYSCGSFRKYSTTGTMGENICKLVLGQRIIIWNLNNSRTSNAIQIWAKEMVTHFQKRKHRWLRDTEGKTCSEPQAIRTPKLKPLRFTSPQVAYPWPKYQKKNYHILAKLWRKDTWCSVGVNIN